MKTEKNYTFDVKLEIEISVVATSEKQARKQLTEQVRDYFAETTVEVGEKEAKLAEIFDFTN